MREMIYIQPATSLEKIKISGRGDITQSSDLFLEYMIHKYPTLKHLDLYTGMKTSANARNCNSFIKLDDIFHTYPHIVHLIVASQCTILISNDNAKKQLGNINYLNLRSLDFSVMNVQSLAYTFFTKQVAKYWVLHFSYFCQMRNT